MSKELIYKICLFGDSNVGKTSLTQAGIQKKEVKPPVCIDIGIKDLTINSLPRYLLMVLALAGDSTITSDLPIVF